MYVNVYGYSNRFAGFGFGGGHQQQEEQRGDDITLDLHATLEDLYRGKVREVLVKNQVPVINTWTLKLKRTCNGLQQYHVGYVLDVNPHHHE